MPRPSTKASSTSRGSSTRPARARTTTANVQLGTGLSDSTSGGWALVVAYGDPAAPSRNLSVFDGMQTVGSSGAVTIPLSGFQTPLYGPGELDRRNRRLRGGSGDARRRRADPGSDGCIHLAVECRQRGHRRPRVELESSSTRRSPTPARWSPRARRASRTTSATTRTSSRTTNRARHRADEHAGETLDQRRRLPARAW